MSLRIKTSLLATAVVGSFGFASVAHAQAFYLQEQSARGAGRAFSGEVADTGPQSLWWNPASIAGMEHGEAAINASGIRSPRRRSSPARSATWRSTISSSMPASSRLTVASSRWPAASSSARVTTE